jgi:hypothetical protein
MMRGAIAMHVEGIRADEEDIPVAEPNEVAKYLALNRSCLAFNPGRHRAPSACRLGY